MPRLFCTVIPNNCPQVIALMIRPNHLLTTDMMPF